MFEDREYRVERFFYKHPGSDVHLRKLARALSISVGYLSKHMGSLVKKGVVVEKHRGNMRIFSANTSSGEYRRRKRGYNIWGILTSGLVSYIENQLYPDTVVLFGSYLKGSDTEDSDIDLAVINGREKSPDLSKYEKKLERKIKLTQLDSLKDAEPEFINTLANGLVLSGHLEVLE